MKDKIIRSALLMLFLTWLLAVPAYAENTEKQEEHLYVPGITVYLSNADTGSGNANPGEKTKVRARVVYEGCTDGEDYVFVMQLEDTSTGEPYIFSPESATIKQPFTAEGRVCFFEFEFEIDASLYPGSILGEIHWIEGLEWAYDMTITDKSGRIYVPEVRNDAVSLSGQKTVLAGKNTVICDVVSYFGFSPDEEYKVAIGLKDASTGKLIWGEDGNLVLSYSKFTPTEPSGQIAAKITADLTKYGDRDIMIYVHIYVVPKSGIPFLLLSSENRSNDNSTVYARLTEISVLDEMYGTPVPDAKIRVASLINGDSYEAVTNENGKCSFPLDSDAVNTCTIVSVPEGYLVGSGSIEFTSSDTQVGSALYIYLLAKKTVVITRTDADTGLPIQGIKTEVRNSEGKLLSSIVSNEAGRAYFDAKPYWENQAKSARRSGQSRFVLTLTFTDSETPSEYYPKGGRRSVYIDENENITGQTEIQSYTRRQVSVTVENVMGVGVPGVEISIIGQDGSIQGRAITDPDGKIYFTPRRTGDYLLVEESVPPGYAPALGAKRISVDEKGIVSGTFTITIHSEDFTTGAAAVLIIGVIFVTGWLMAARKRRRKKARSED